MFTSRSNRFVLPRNSLAVIITLAVGYLPAALVPLRAADPVPPVPRASSIKDLKKEHLAVVRENLELATKAYSTGGGTFADVQEATHLVLKAEFEQCGSGSESIAVLEKFIVELKKQEERAGELVKAGQLSRNMVLKARADRLNAEILLEQTKAGSGDAPAPTSDVQDLVDLAKIQVQIKRVGVKAAEGQLKIAVAKLESSKAQVVEADALASAAKEQYDRLVSLAKKGAAAIEEVAERQGQWEAAKARTDAAKAKVAECAAQVNLEQTHVELAKLEVDDAELRLKQLVAKLPKK
jgi:hypothetical protein